ncbi:hypothetical protein BMS3Abin12_00399 [bacterium BMS3Abin12]|nr:hypothetical protein BMS3Abin12_00399 [bacterium BMS3Abin12]
MTIKTPVLPGLALCASLAFAPLAHAAVTEVEGAAGGGIVPWALLAPSTPTASFTYVNTGDYSLTSLGVSGTVFKRLELSYARQAFNTESVGLGTINVDTFGAKVKLLDMSAMLPQVAVGVMYKVNEDQNKIPFAAHHTGVDVYVAATKVLKVTGKNVLVDATVRMTKANQLGILGFGANGLGNSDSYSANFEGSAGLFVTANTIVGAEYRMKPNNLAGDGLKENGWWDVFFAYIPNPHFSVTAAYANLGNIAQGACGLPTSSSTCATRGRREKGLYLQVQSNY